MAKTKIKADTDVIDTIDQDIRVACNDRAKAWRDLVVKDSPANRSAYDAACTCVDELLDMRLEAAPLAY